MEQGARTYYEEKYGGEHFLEGKVQGANILLRGKIGGKDFFTIRKEGKH